MSADESFLIGVMIAALFMMLLAVVGCQVDAGGTVELHHSGTVDVTFCANDPVCLENFHDAISAEIAILIEGGLCEEHGGGKK